MPRKTTVCKVKLTNEDGEQMLHIEVDSEIEELFKNDDTKTSEKYMDADGEALEFYELKSKLARYADEFNEEAEGDVQIGLREYGSDLMRNGKVNLSILRTVGIEDGIDVNVSELVLDTDLENWAKTLAEFLKFIYEKFVTSKEVKAEVTFEY